jgi:hypothetical protein
MKWNEDMTMSNSSKDKLSQCDPELQRLITAVSNYIDIVVSCGHRGKEDQDRAVAEHKSKTPYPTSKHNSLPSRAVDVEPLKRSTIDWNDRILFYFTAGFIQCMADVLNIKIRLGADFNMDKDLHNDSFIDLPHIELR